MKQFRGRQRTRSFLVKNDIGLSGTRSSIQRIHFYEFFKRNVKESDLILMESYPDHSKKGRFRKLSIQMKNDFEPRGNHSITVWNAKERVPSYTEHILVTSERIH